MYRKLVILSLLTGFAVSAQATDGVPHGWLLAGNKPQSYRTGIEDSGTAYLVSKVTDTGGFGTLMQSIAAQSYAGKRVRFRASVRSQGVSDWAGLWMRVDKGTDSVAFDNMERRPIKGTAGWQTYDIVLDVPTDATGISFGTLVQGSGEVWLNHLSFEVVDNKVPATGPTFGVSKLSLAPMNLDFQQ